MRKLLIVLILVVFAAFAFANNAEPNVSGGMQAVQKQVIGQDIQSKSDVEAKATLMKINQNAVMPKSFSVSKVYIYAVPKAQHSLLVKTTHIGDAFAVSKPRAFPLLC
jgi:hypothetical protein